MIKYSLLYDIIILLLSLVLINSNDIIITNDNIEILDNLSLNSLSIIKLTKINKNKQTIRIIKHINQPYYCSTIEFINLPNPNYSPFINGPKFELTNELYNNKPAWFNGKEYLSYTITDNGDNTWIVGLKPGVDSGYIFLKPSIYVLLPIYSKKIDESTWHWLMRNSWISQPEVDLICLDNNTVPIDQQSYYVIEYFDDITSQSYQSILILTQSTNVINRLANQLDDSIIASYLNKRTNQWELITSIQSVVTMGDLYLVSDSSDSNPQPAHLVNQEHAYNNGWHLTFRYVHSNLSKEIDIEIDDNGPRDGKIITNLSNEQKNKQRIHYTSNLITNLSIGSYIWLWFTYDNLNIQRNESNDLINAAYELIDEMLLECIGISNNKAIFRYYPSDRIFTMRQTTLVRDTNYVIMNINRETNLINYEISGHKLIEISSILLGNDIIRYIRDYLVDKDRFPTSSSCYFYHAAVSLPRPLVYAAELICVLLGAKPMAMIQYTTPSDHQWKFPLVQRLVSKIITFKHLFNDSTSFPINTVVFKYNSDETLIIYQSKRLSLVDSLAPVGKRQAQALHPLPYPDRSNLHNDWKLQIYYAYWNGIVLGYPKSFVESYCLSFDNGLTYDERLQQIQLADYDLNNYFINNQIDKVSIGFGLDQSIDEQLWEFI